MSEPLDIAFVEAWETWCENNHNRYPLSEYEFIRSVYQDGYGAGKQDKNHMEVMTELVKLRETIEGVIGSHDDISNVMSE